MDSNYRRGQIDIASRHHAVIDWFSQGKRKPHALSNGEDRALFKINPRGSGMMRFYVLCGQRATRDRRSAESSDVAAAAAVWRRAIATLRLQAGRPQRCISAAFFSTCSRLQAFFIFGYGCGEKNEFFESTLNFYLMKIHFETWED